MIKMPAAKINLSQMVDLAVGTPEVGAVNANVLHTLLHAMLRHLNIVDVQADLNDSEKVVLSASKARELSVLSDVDSGRGDDAVDAHTSHSESSSSIPAPSHGKRTPYQYLKVKGAKLQEKLKRIRSVPSNSKNQLVSRVETDEKEIAKLNIDDLMKRLNAMEKSTNEMNDRFSTLPSHDDFAKFVTRAGLEDTLQGIRQDCCGNLQQPMERAVIKMSSQIDPVPSRPSTSCSVTLGEKKLGRLGESHQVLTRRVEELESEMGKKLDQGALEGLNVHVSSAIIEQLQVLKEQVDTLAAARNQICEPLKILASASSTRSVTTNEVLLQQNKKEMQAADITSLEMKVSMLQNQLYQFQDTINLDDSTRWEMSRGTQYEEEFSRIFTQNGPDKTRKLASVVNNQLHDIRDALYKVDKKLKKKAKVVEIQSEQGESEPVEIPLERTRLADFYDTDLDDLLRSQNANRADIKKLVTYCNELNHDKADRAEVHEKADNNKMALVAINSLIERKNDYILNRMAVNEENWNEQCQIFSDDISEKLDREELEPLKKALNDKLKKQNQAPVEWVDDDAARIRRPVLPPVSSVSNHQALPPSRLPRPLTVKMDQIQRHTKSDTSTSTCITSSKSQSSGDFDRAVARRQKPKMCQSVEALQKQRDDSNNFTNVDNNATNRSCGGQHTTTNPHMRLSKLPVYSMTKLPHLSNTIIKENEETNYPLYKEKDVDGNIDKERMEHVNAKLPPVTQATRDPSSMQRKDKSPQQMRRNVMWKVKLSSDKMLYAPRPPPKNGSHPH